MKNSSIQLLHKGQRRKVQKQEYLKLRTYNKIKTSRSYRPNQSQLSNTSTNTITNSNHMQISTSRTLDRSDINCEQLVQINECVRKQAISLFQENRAMLKYVRKCEKIDRLILKKFPFLCETFNTEESTVNQDECEKENQEISQSKLNEKEIQLMLEFKLALDVIQLEEKLEQKQQLMKILQSNKRKEHEQDIIDSLFKQKVKFLSLLYTDMKDAQQKLKQFSLQDNKIKQAMNSILSKQKQVKKQKQNAIKNMQKYQFELKQVQESAQQRKKRLRKNSCEYIQIQNGQVKSQQDLKRQLEQLKQRRKIESQKLQVYLEQKMIEKIALRTEIEKQQTKCNSLVPKLVPK